MKTPNRFLHFIIISAITHLILLLGLSLKDQSKQLNPNQAIEISLETPKLIDASINKKIRKEKKPDNQLVETNPDQANNQSNPNAKLLSAKNNQTDKETIAKLADQFKNVDQDKKLAQAKTEKTNLNVNKKSLQKKNLTTSNTTDLSDKLFGDKFNPFEAAEKQAQQNLNQSGSDMGEQSTATDRVDGVKDSLKTTLNTREYKYYGYYQRIKSQLNQFWQPQVREKVTRLISKGRTIANDSNKITKLIIVLNEAGTLVKVQVLSESGVRDLDEAAIEAFRQAAPFPNPPRGIIETDGTIKIRWDFVVES